MIRDDATGFAIDLATPNASVCIIEPRALFDAVACAGIDPEPTRKVIAKMQTPQKTAIGVATVRHDGWSYDALILRQVYGGAGAMKPERVDAWLRATKAGVKEQIHRDVEATNIDGTPFAPIVLNDMNVLAVAMQPIGADGPALRILGWSFVADDRIVSVSFFTDAAHVDVAREEAKGIVATATWPAARDSRARGTFGQKPTARSAWTTTLAIVGAIVVALVVLSLLRRRKRRDVAPTKGA